MGDPVYGPSIWMYIEFTGLQDIYSVKFNENGDSIDPEVIIYHSEMREPILNIFNVVIGWREYYEIPYADVPYKGDSENYFYVEANGINGGWASDGCSNVVYDFPQRKRQKRMNNLTSFLSLL